FVSFPCENERPGSMMVSPSKMFAWGANTHGQLGTGDTTDRFEPEYIEGVNVSVVTGGGRHSVHTDVTYFRLGFKYASFPGVDVYTCGSNSAGQVGRENFPLHFQKIGMESKYPVASVICGWDFTFVLQSDGGLFAFGSNAHNQLLCNDIRRISKPIRASLPTVRCVAAGLRHVVAISASNEVLLWGSNHRGQLGTTASKTIKNGPVCLKLDTSQGCPVTCSSGAYHSVILTDAGFVFIIGELRYFGEDGNVIIRSSSGDLPAYMFTPDSFGGRPIVQTASGWSNVLALTALFVHFSSHFYTELWFDYFAADTGVLFTWGRSDLGQLGRPHLSDCHSGSPRIPEFDPFPGRVSFGDDDGSVTRIVDIRAGAEHSLAVDSDGDLWTWGWNEHGMCGIPKNAISESVSLDCSGGIKHCPCVIQPSRVNLLPLSTCQGLRPATTRLIGAGYGHSFAYVV
ncbi:secretion-regulating guanine nucleotide exchange factor, partial [Paragonimus westermani]